MRICIIDGTPQGSSAHLTTYLTGLELYLQSSKQEVKIHSLRDMNLRMCIGCFDCWTKTPGQCVQKDDLPLILKDIVAADFLILASPIIMGLVSAQLKTVNDRFLPLLLPYMDISSGESHHPLRYGKFPDFGMILEKTPGSDDEDIEIIHGIYQRQKLNYHFNFRFFTTIDKPVKEVADEINRR